MRTRATTARRMALAGMLALGGVLVLGGAKPAAAGVAAITSCGAQITTPGTYVLVNDLNCPTQSFTIHFRGPKPSPSGEAKDG